MKLKSKTIEQEIDKMTDPIQWFDLVSFNYYIQGNYNQKIPVEWGRERFKRFMKKYEIKE